MATYMAKHMTSTLKRIRSGLNVFSLSKARYSSEASDSSEGNTGTTTNIKSIAVTEDGIIKKSGLLLNATTMFDGKPVFPGKYKIIKVPEGTIVRAGTTLYQQKRLDYHPGLYVGLGRDLTLYAYEDGVVYITCEKVAFNWSLPLVESFYNDERGMNIYKMYYHVIPKEQHKRFKLVSQT